MEQHLESHITDEIFFPELTNAHLNRGIIELQAELKLAKTKEKLLLNLMK